MHTIARTQIELTIARHVADGIARKLHIQQGNVVSRRGVLDFVKAIFGSGNSNTTTFVAHWPWRLPAQLTGLNLNVPWGYGSATGGIQQWYTWSGGTLDVYDGRRCRRLIAPWSYPKTAVPQVHAAILTGYGTAGQNSATLFAASDIPMRMIGQPWAHPAVAMTNVAIVLGGAASQPYITPGAAVGGTVYGQAMPAAWGHAYIRITSGPDAGVYRCAYYDAVNNRLYLRNLNGTNFVPAGGAQTGLTALIFFRTSAYFNENGITPASQGVATMSGTYNPGTARQSRLIRLHFERSGSPSPVGGAHLTGSYWFTSRPYVYGQGNPTANYQGAHDDSHSFQSVMPGGSLSFFTGFSAGFVGGTPGMALDVANQRLWGCADNGTNSDIWWGLYKTPEGFHEVATSTGVPNDPIAGITMAGSRARGLVMGTDGTVYVALGGTNAGLVKITTSLVASQWAAGNTNVNGLAIDKSRARSTAAGTVSTGLLPAGAANRILVTGGAFTQADVGRVITLSGGSADNGSYRIATVTDATTITVETVVANTAPGSGGNVTFTGTTNSGAMRIGDRIYVFYNDTTGWAGSGAGFINMRYMETEAWNTLLTTGDLAVTASTGRTLYDGHATNKGLAPVAAVDPINGNLFWVSDTAQRINRYDVTSRAVTQKAISTFTAAGDASGFTTPGIVYCIGVNPHADFREVWLGTDYGLVRFSADHADLSTLAAQNPYVWALPTANYRRYYGNGSTTVGVQPTGYMRLDGLGTGGPVVGNIWFGRDGKVWTRSAFTSLAGRGVYEREVDTFINAATELQYFSGTTPVNSGPGVLVTPDDELVVFCPGGNIPVFTIAGLPIDFQWNGSTWVPKQVTRGPIPDATSSPGCATKDLHTTADDLLWGVKVQFGTGAGGDAVQFVGRMSQKQAVQIDGAWAGGNFTGSNFTSSDVGRLLRVESGGNQGVYIVTAYVDAFTITVQTLARAAFGPTETGPLNYTLWDYGNSGAGAETLTVVAADGLFADNTQDITNIVAETYYAKTVLSEQAEAVKVAYGIPPPPGSIGIAVYHANSSGATAVPGSPSGQPLDSGSPVTLAEQVVDYVAGKHALDGTEGRATLTLDSTLRGVDANANDGTAITVDMGTDVEVGAIIVRMHGSANSPATLLNTENTGTSGMIGNVHKANSAGGAPVQAVTSTHRRSTLVGGSGMGLPRTSPPTATLSSGDFLAAASVTYSDGATVQGANTLTSAAGRFTGLTGGVVRLTSGSDLGYYRIIAVDGTGAVATVRNLDQTAKAWGASASGLSFVIHADAAREDDILLAGTHRTTIEMLTSPTVARVRTYAPAAVTNGTWEVLTPTWTLVKRLSHSVQALPPDVANNGTFVEPDGMEGAPLGSSIDRGMLRCVFDFSDLPTVARTGRWWKFTYIGRFTTSSGQSGASLTGVEFYDTSGKRLLAGASNMIDTVESEPEFMACHVTRLDWIQAQYAASTVVPGVNALATLGGTTGSTVTLAGGVPFLPHKVFQGTTITAAGGNATISLGGADRPFTAADIGRILYIQAGPNVGYWRIVTTPTTTSATLVNMSGVAPTLSADATPRAWSLHEGILAGTTNFDYLYLAGYGEFSINAVSNDLLTITLNDATALSASGLAWEIRRRAVPVLWYQTSTPAGVDATQVARLLYSHCEAPRQSGDVLQDHKGALSFHPTDVGTALTRTADGTSAAGTGYQTFTSAGSLFTPDDVGRMLIILTGADAGTYLIRSYVSAAQVTVQHLRSGGQVTWTGVAAVNYKVVGERRFRASRYVTVLRQ